MSDKSDLRFTIIEAWKEYQAACPDRNDDNPDEDGPFCRNSDHQYSMRWCDLNQCPEMGSI